jgi:hypothetical protein
LRIAPAVSGLKSPNTATGNVEWEGIFAKVPILEQADQNSGTDTLMNGATHLDTHRAASSLL